MNFNKVFKGIKLPELLMFAIFALDLIFPVSTPSAIAPYIESPLGLLVIFCITVGLFIHSNPLLAVLYIFVAYTLLRRSATIKNVSQYIETTKTTSEKNREVKAQIQEATPPHEEARTAQVGATQPTTLEEEVVNENAPIGRSETVVFQQSSYKPVSTDVTGSSEIL